MCIIYVARKHFFLFGPRAQNKLSQLDAAEAI